MKKVLFIGMHRPNRSPSQRFRFEQYFDFLKEKGFECHLSYIISKKDDKILYRNGYYFSKLRIFISSILKRHRHLRKAKNYDYIFIQREAFMTGSTYFERKLSELNIPLIYDFDDAIWLEDESSHHGLLSKLRNPRKTKDIIELADIVIVGNEYLADFASQLNDNVLIIPTTIDTNWYKPSVKSTTEPIIIGWTGSFSTIKHYNEIIPVLLKIKSKYKERIEFSVIGDPSFSHNKLGIQGKKWEAESEVEDLEGIDIGIMPLPDNDWTRGKCGAKGLQYMGLAIPAIMSSVGVNKDIIQDGVNGFLADTDEEWFNKLCQLIESDELRSKLGAAGRETVVSLYSIEANKEKYLKLFE